MLVGQYVLLSFYFVQFSFLFPYHSPGCRQTIEEEEGASWPICLFIFFIYFHHFFFYLFLSSPGYKQTIIDGGKVLIVQYVLSEIYNTCNFAFHLALECNFRLTAYL